MPDERFKRAGDRDIAPMTRTYLHTSCKYARCSAFEQQSSCSDRNYPQTNVSKSWIEVKGNPRNRTVEGSVILLTILSDPCAAAYVQD